jgi:hypothetical protein
LAFVAGFLATEERGGFPGVGEGAEGDGGSGGVAEVRGFGERQVFTHLLLHAGGFELDGTDGAPVGEGDGVDEVAGEGVLRFERGFEIFQDVFEDGGIFNFEADVAGEVVRVDDLAGVLGRAALPFGGDGAAGFGAVGARGVGLAFGGHGGRLLVSR